MQEIKIMDTVSNCIFDKSNFTKDNKREEKATINYFVMVNDINKRKIK